MHLRWLWTPIRVSFQYLLLVTVVCVLAGCVEQHSAADDVVRRDSAGIAIVESYSPLWEAGSAWSLDAEPELSMGEESADLHHEFTEVVGVRMVGDSIIVVADLMIAEVRFFLRDGTVLGVVGGRGSGPGEFQRIQALGGAGGDTTWVFDWGLNRITLLTLPGHGERVVNVVPPVRSRMVGRLPDKGWLLSRLAPRPVADGMLTAGIHRGLDALVRHGHDGVFSDTLSLVAGQEVVFRIEDAELRAAGPPAFGRRSTAAVGGSGYFAGDQVAFEIGEYNSNGNLRRLIRLPNYDLTMSPEDLEDFFARRTAAAPEASRAQFRAMLESLPRAESSPAYQDFLVDAIGNLWTSTVDYGARGRQTWGGEWNVFDSTGRWLGVVQMPAHFLPMDIGDDWVLGIHTDDLDVQHVRLHRLIK